MPDPIPLPTRQPRGPAPPPPPPTDPRLQDFPLLPGEDSAAWTTHAHDVLAGLGPADAFERKLVAAVAVGMWREARADRIEAEVLTDIGPAGAGRCHGSDLWEPVAVAALGAALRCQAAAAIATGRALRHFLAHRKARAAGLLGSDGGERAVPARTFEPNGPREPDPLSCTSEPGGPAQDEPSARTYEPGRPLGTTVAERTDEPNERTEDPDAWLARCPVVEADPSDESLRRALLGTVEHPIMRDMIMGAPLKGIEQFVVCDDAVAYEEWFAKQPKPDFPPMDLPESYKADILHVTRHNPPWARGEYLGYYRPPVPRHLFDADRGPLDANDMPVPPRTSEPEPPEPAAPAPAAPAPAAASPDLAARIARLLDRKAQRQADELDLAEAICAVRWRQWPPYAGKVDLDQLRRVLQGVRIDSSTLDWLAGRDIQKKCREAARLQDRGDGA